MKQRNNEKAKQKQLDELFSELVNEPLESLRRCRLFSDRFYADLFKPQVDRLAWDRLSKRELICLILRYYPVSSSGIVNWENIAKRFGVTRERMHQIGTRAIRKLQN